METIRDQFGSKYQDLVMSISDYHGDKESMSSTGIKELCHSIPDYLNYISKPQERKECFDFGNIAHLMILEPEEFEETVIVTPTFNLKSNLGRAQKKEFVDKLKPHQLLTDEKKLETLKKMRDSVLTHPIAGNGEKEILENIEPELSFYSDDPNFDIRKRCRFDGLKATEQEGVFDAVDIKTTAIDTIYDDDIQRVILDHGYHISEAWYRDVFEESGFGEIRNFYFIFVQKKAPFKVKVIQLDPELIQIGRSQIYDGLEELEEWKKSNSIYKNRAKEELKISKIQASGYKVNQIKDRILY